MDVPGADSAVSGEEDVVRKRDPVGEDDEEAGVRIWRFC
jgi:hypothetical protein